MNYSREIDGLRAVAVLTVVLFHLGVERFSGGYIGVDVFFTISGYLITGIILRDIQAGRFSIIRFWQRRARRILPALFTVVVFCLIASSFILFPAELHLFGESAAATMVFASNFLFWSETGYFDLAADMKPLLHTWSLAVEEQFYLVIPWLLVLCVRGGRAVLHGVVLLLLAASFVASVYWVASDVEFAFYMPHTRAWELLVGSFLALGAVPKIGARVAREILMLSGLAAIFYASITLSSGTPFPGAAALYPCFGAAAIIHAQSSGDTFVGWLLRSKPMVSIGLISYSLYLWHWPLIVYAHYITGEALTPGLMAVVFISSIVLAWVSWRFVESPMRHSNYWWGQRLFAGSVGVSLLLMVSGLSLALFKGFPERFNEEFQAVLKLQYKTHDRRDCHFVSVARVNSGNLCVRGAEDAKPSFVFVGDSHADTMSTPVFKAADELGLSGYQFTQAGFRPLPGVRQMGRSKSGLLADRFVTFLEEHPELDVVILHAFWKIHVTGESFRHKNLVYVDEQYDGSGTAYNAKSFESGLARLVAQFPERRFIVVEDIPSGVEFDLNRLLRILYFSGRGLEEIGEVGGLSRSVYDAEVSLYRPVLKNLVAEGNLQIAPVSEVLCGADFCPVVRDGQILYRDGDHLTATGADLFTDYFTELLDDVMD